MSCFGNYLYYLYSSLNMMAKLNVPRCTLCIVVLLALILVSFKLLNGGKSLSAEKKFKQKTGYKSPPAFIQNSKRKLPADHGRRSSRNTSRRNRVPEVPTSKMDVQEPSKPSKPQIRSYALKWKHKGNVFYREVLPINGAPKLDILLLHGNRFTSSNWVDLKTMNILAAFGFRVIAMDLPGFGQSTYKLADKTDKTRGKFLDEFIKKARLVSPVIVSPSRSGIYSLPYIVGLRQANKVSGFVAIAVEATNRFSREDYKHFTAPTLIMRGSRDNSLGVKSMEMLRSAIRNSIQKILEGAGHACYLDKPKEFHEALLKFLNGIVKDKDKGKSEKRVILG